MQEIFEIVNREADLSMNRIVVMIKDMGMQDQVGKIIGIIKNFFKKLNVS